MALNQTNKLAWIVKTIQDAKKITFEELNEKWIENADMSFGEPMPKRTFHKWKQSILDTFGLLLECDRNDGYRYYIANQADINENVFENWLLNTYSVSNSLLESKSIKDRIILENVPSGMKYLDPIINAMKENRCIHITYYNYWRDDEREHFVMPLCVKLFRQRWYFVAKSCVNDYYTIYCLDRIRDLKVSDQTFDYPANFSPKEFFDGYFGVVVMPEVKKETVRLKATSAQANYLRDLPLMTGGNQREVERTDSYSIFEIDVHPTSDFIQEILWNGEEVEVLEPKWLREELTKTIKRMNNNYKEVKQ